MGKIRLKTHQFGHFQRIMLWHMICKFNYRSCLFEQNIKKARSYQLANIISIKWPIFVCFSNSLFCYILIHYSFMLWIISVFHILFRLGVETHLAVVKVSTFPLWDLGFSGKYWNAAQNVFFLTPKSSFGISTALN